MLYEPPGSLLRVKRLLVALTLTLVAGVLLVGPTLGGSVESAGRGQADLTLALSVAPQQPDDLLHSGGSVTGGGPSARNVGMRNWRA